MKPITGSMAVTEAPDCFPQPTEAQGYLAAAQGMLTGAVLLGKEPALPVFALTLLCGHACEAALKAVLAQHGFTAKALSNKPYGHNLLNLWTAVAGIGIALPNPQPAWIDQLNRVYDKPFHLRYPLGFHGIVLPNQLEMLRGAEGLVSVATSFVR